MHKGLNDIALSIYISIYNTVQSPLMGSLTGQKASIRLSCISNSIINFCLVSVDISEAQNALLELKLTAIKCLDDYNEFLQLLGEMPSDKR